LRPVQSFAKILTASASASAEQPFLSLRFGKLLFMNDQCSPSETKALSHFAFQPYSDSRSPHGAMMPGEQKRPGPSQFASTSIFVISPDDIQQPTNIRSS
jgi:hypothetical protein